MARLQLTRPFGPIAPAPAPAPVLQPAPMPQAPNWSLFGIPLPGARPPVAPAPGAAGGASPVASHGVNDTGRTTPFNPNPSFANNTTFGSAGAPAYPAGSGSPSSQGGGAPSSSNPLGMLGSLFAMLGLPMGQQGAQYEAALRERPADIQRLVSMSRRPEERSQNSGGFLGGMFDNRG